MSCFYYWLPNRKTSIALADLCAAGLGYAFENRKTARGCDNGPDGQRGVVVCSTDNKDGRLGYYADAQAWRQMPQSEVWVGHYSADKPPPQDLLRSECVPGEWVTADDGTQWMAPVARKRVPVNGDLYWMHGLPRRMQLNAVGEWEPGGVKARYERLWQDAVLCEQSVMEGVDAGDLNEIAVRALQANYRVSAVELDVLGVFDESFRNAVVGALIDLATWLDWLKKKAAAANDGDSC